MIPTLLLSPRLWIAAGIAVASFLGGMSVHKIFTDRKISALELRHAEAIASWESQVSAAHAKARETERALQSQVDAARTEAADEIRTAQELYTQISVTNRQLAVARRDAAGLRNQVAAYAAGRGTEDSVAACQARAGRLGDLLASCSGLLDEGRELARAAGQAADERGVKLRACLAGWPRND